MNALKRIMCALPTFALMMSLGVGNSASAQSFPDSIPLPPGFQPEGITLGSGPTAYVGSLAGGGIYEVDLRTGAGGMLIPAMPYQVAVGLDFDSRNGYLFVAGGITGDGRVYDTGTGGLVAQVPFVDPGFAWINDVFVARDAAYFTNSFAPEIYKVPLTDEGMPSGPAQRLELSGDWLNITIPGALVINANGIVATADGGTLIVVNYALGYLYKVDPDTGYATRIDLEGVLVPSGDGLVLRGKTLYVVQNFAGPGVPGQIAVFRLSTDYSAATLTRILTEQDPFVAFIPSTADLFGTWLYAVNARFDVCTPVEPCPPNTAYSIVRVEH